MKLLLGLFGFGLFAASLLPAQKAEKPWVLVIGGDTRGYLSPCGCVKPMAGGIRRRATAIRAMGERRIVIENASLSGGVERQDELKLDAQAESLREMGVDAVNLGGADAALGPGALLNLKQLAGGKLLTGSLAPSPTLEIESTVTKGPVLVGGVSARAAEVAEALRETALPMDAAVRNLLSEAKASGKLAVLMLDGGEAIAKQLAERHPELAAIVYQAKGDPAAAPLKLGRTLLLSPGEKGKFLLRMNVDAKGLTGYTAVKLNPEFKDDPKVSAVYASYLARVDQEGLLDKLPRTAKGKFIGSQACQQCHDSDYEIWTKSRHAKALATLEKEGHARDPDCVSCHVVALDAEEGFRSRAKTPFLADVGCESCHGAGAAHSYDPTVKMGKVSAASCAPCHNVEHSPGFNYEAYWAKIKHGR